MTKMLECPKHEGAFDCNAFCDVCEGNQEYVWTATRGCVYCGTAVEHDTWFEELGMCLECSNRYWDHEEMGYQKKGGVSSGQRAAE